MFGIDIFNYGHVMPNLAFKSEDGDFVWKDQSTTLGFINNPAVRTTQYLDYVITHSLSNDRIDYHVDGLDPKYGGIYYFDVETTASKDGVIKKTWINTDKQFRLLEGQYLNGVGQEFRGYIFHLEGEAAKWIKSDIENNKESCSDLNRVETEDENCGECLDGFMVNDDDECITCASMNQKDGIGGRCGTCIEGFIVDEDTDNATYGTCVAESAKDNTILYAGGGLIAIAIVATLMKKK